MTTPPTPSDESRRLATLRSLNLLDSAPEERFDRVTRLARQVFAAPIALVTLVDADRQWFKSSNGLEISQTPRKDSFCAYTILDDRITVVTDASKDQRFRDNPLVSGEPNVRFYAGYPLSAPDGSRVGTLCVYDTVAREITLEQAQLLRDLGRMVEEELVDADHATIDPITSLSNRNGFLMIADHVLSTCARTEKAATMLVFRFTNLRKIHDEFGHEKRDVAAIEFAHELMSGFRHSDIIARITPDLFCVLLAGTSLDDVVHARRRFGEDINHRNRDIDNHRKLLLDVEAIAFDPARHRDAKGLLKDAEAQTHERRITAA